MTTTSQLSLAEVKTHLSAIVDRVRRQHERVTVTVHGRPSAMLVAVDDIDALEETIAILADSEAMRELVESERELARGDAVSAEELAAATAARRRAAG